jgi:hypothetical protein
VLPGVRELLNWLDEQADVKLGLLTGNYEPIAGRSWREWASVGRFPFGQTGCSAWR